MYPPGHAGITAILISALIYLFLVVGRERAGLRWLGLSIALTLAPDLDGVLPGMVHRGITHTFLAALVLGVVVAAVAWASGFRSTHVRVGRATLGFLVGAGGVVSHLLGDVITPMGVRLLFPLRNTVYTLDVVRASDPEANLSFLLVGVTALAISYRAGTVATPEETSAPDVEAEESTAPTS